LNAKLRGIGKVSELSIDTKKRSLHVRLELAGERDPVEIHVAKYRLATKGDETTLTVVDAHASRKWLTAALREFVVGRTFTIPEQAGAAIKLLA